MERVLKGYAGRRCQLELFCAGDRAREGTKQGHPAVKINFKQQFSHKGCCCVVEDDCVQCSAGLGTVLHSCLFWSLSIWVELCTHLLRLAPL